MVNLGDARSYVIKSLLARLSEVTHARLSPPTVSAIVGSQSLLKRNVPKP